MDTDRLNGQLAAIDLVSAVVRKDSAAIALLNERVRADPAPVMNALLTLTCAVLTETYDLPELQDSLSQWRMACIAGAQAAAQ